MLILELSNIQRKTMKRLIELQQHLDALKEDIPIKELAARLNVRTEDSAEYRDFCGAVRYAGYQVVRKNVWRSKEKKAGTVMIIKVEKQGKT